MNPRFCQFSGNFGKELYYPAQIGKTIPETDNLALTIMDARNYNTVNSTEFLKIRFC